MIFALFHVKILLDKTIFMKTVKKSILIWYSPAEMYSLVIDVDAYPKFLPWCDNARVVEHEKDGMLAEISIAFAGVRRNFTTRNHHIPDRQVRIGLVHGPFSKLEGQWNFLPVGHGQQRACKVELVMTYGFDKTLSKLIGPVFDKIASSMVEAFVKRAKQIYGE
jgi:ribosome-associated toxin RatA of RatAB toxin-antitoxin module